MKNIRRSRVKYLLFVLIIVLTSHICITAESNSLTYYLGEAQFRAEYSTIFFPQGIHKIFIDTNDCQGCRDSLPEWRYIGDLKIDSLKRNGAVEQLIEESQISGVIIGEQDLLNLLNNRKIYTIEKSIPSAVLYDTLIWSRVRHKYTVVQDRAKFFHILFNESIEVDSVVNQLKLVPGLSAVQRSPIYYQGNNSDLDNSTLTFTSTKPSRK